MIIFTNLNRCRLGGTKENPTPVTLDVGWVKRSETQHQPADWEIYPPNPPLKGELRCRLGEAKENPTPTSSLDVGWVKRREIQR